MKTKDLFWPGFVGLLTCMFVVMLVMFCLSFKVYSGKTTTIVNQNSRLMAVEKEYLRGKRINGAVEALRKDTIFDYLPSGNRFIIRSLKSKELFERNEAALKTEYLKELVNAGHALQNFLQGQHSKYVEIPFLLIIEGNVDENYDNSLTKEKNARSQLSYQRGLAVYQLWNNAGIDFQKYGAELLIAGKAAGSVIPDEVRGHVFFSIRLLPTITIE